MNTSKEKTQMGRLIEKSNNIAVIPAVGAGIDGLSAAIGLILSIRDTSFNNEINQYEEDESNKRMEKNVFLVYPKEISQDYKDYVNPNFIIEDPSLRDLIVEINYSDSPASKVNYSIDNETLKIVLTPVKRNFNTNNVKTKIMDRNFDLIITIGAARKEDLGLSYFDMEDEYKKAVILNIDNNNDNTHYGLLNIVNPKIESLSLLMINLILRNGLTLNANTGKALLTGLIDLDKDKERTN
ncbi:MAG TPA: hypothetical protein PKK54_00570 [bacterium]|nr:hypothetical protein [bacterium]